MSKPFLKISKYVLRTEKGQAKEDNFLFSLPFFIVFLSLFNFPQLYLHSGKLLLHLRKTQGIIFPVLLI